MSSSKQPRTKEVERKSVEAVSKTETQHYCPNCEQWYDDESDVVPIRAGSREVESEEDQLCITCFEKIFGYRPEPELRGALKEVASSPKTTALLLNSVMAVAIVGGLAVMLVHVHTIMDGVEALFLAPQSIALTAVEADEQTLFTSFIPNMFMVAFPAMLWFLFHSNSGGERP